MNDDEAEILRMFQAAVSGLELADLRELAGDPSQLLGDPNIRGGADAAGGLASLRRPQPVARPELRRPPLPHLQTFRIRIDLNGARPPIWRRLDLRSDLTLDAVHKVIQTAFDWLGYHLHRFSLGGDPFDPAAQIFLCPFDVQEREPEDDGGIPAAHVRLDETVQEPGDVLAYVYDYGDNWALTLRLEEVLPADADAPTAVAVDGARAAPPEDSGGATDARSLSKVLEDPARFDLDELNKALRDPFFVMREKGLHPGLVDLMNRLSFTRIGDDIVTRCMAVAVAPVPQLSDDELRAALSAHRWFLDKAAASDIPLTAAGYLKPADVAAAAAVMPEMKGWFGKANRENLTFPVLDFRESLQSLGLLRKYKGALRLTRLGASAQRDAETLWTVLADKLTSSKERFVHEATLLSLLYAATSEGQPVPLEQVTSALGELGWRYGDRQPLPLFEVNQLGVWSTLRNIGTPGKALGVRALVSHEAAQLAITALRSPEAR